MTILDLPDAAGPTRDALILKHIVAGDAEVTWGSLVVGPITLLVMADALKLGGVRVGAGAGLAQQAADALGALLLTPKILDLMYSARAVTIEPQTQYDATQMLMTHWFEKESARIDAAIAAAGGVEAGQIVQTVGKPWMISNALLAHPGKGENYGWHVPPGSVKNGQWRSTPAYPSVTLPGIYVLQQPGWAHGLDEADYSEMIVLMHRSCTVDGEPRDLAEVLTDSTLAPLISHEGPLRVLRQPGVAQFSCALPAQMAVKATSGFQAAAYGLCPAVAAPSGSSLEPGVVFMTAAVSFALGLAGGVAFAGR